jgi:hypothetical protein
LDAETRPPKSPPETTYARRDQKDPKPVAQIPAQTAYLNLTGKHPVRGDWVVGLTGIEPVTHRFRSIDATGHYDDRSTYCGSIVERTARIE